MLSLMILEVEAVQEVLYLYQHGMNCQCSLSLAVGLLCPQGDVIQAQLNVYTVYNVFSTALSSHWYPWCCSTRTLMIPFYSSEMTQDHLKK